MTAPIISTLMLSHVRSHRRTELIFDGRPVVIHGPNGAGKTTVLEALSLLSPGKGLRQAISADIARRPESLGWKIGAVLAGRMVETSSSGHASRTVFIDGKPAPQIALGQLARLIWLVPTMDRLWTEGAEGRRRFLDRMVLSFIPSHAEAVLVYEKAMRERNRLLREQVRDQRWYAAIETQMAASGALIDANRRSVLTRFAEFQEWETPAFPFAELALLEGEGDRVPGQSQDLASALALGRTRDMAAGRTLVGPHRTDLQARYAAKGIDAAQCSTGEQKALLVSLVLTNARALKAETGRPPVLLLDEIAAHFDDRRLRALFDEISALGTQAFMTGTEPELFDGLGARAMWYAVREDNGVSEVIEEKAP